MILIAHRGNLNGPNADRENSPDYIHGALKMGFHAEIDVWYDDGWHLGHDAPTHPVSLDFLKIPKLWLHCKNVHALDRSLSYGLHCFYHNDDNYTLTNYGHIWAYPGQPGTNRSICVLPELNNQDVREFAGVCSDYVLKYL